MASLLPKIFKRKREERKEKVKKEEQKTVKQDKPIEDKPVAAGKEPGTSEIAWSVLINPRITEKTTAAAEKGVYVFDVSERASKNLVKRAVEELYRVGVKRVRIGNLPAKSRFIRGRRGTRPGYKKAVVYLREGDKIEFV